MINGALKVLQAGPCISVQDEGRSGWLRHGVTQGGAMDLRALEQGRLLVGNEPGKAALEIFAMGGRFEALDKGLTLALTGARFPAKIDAQNIAALTSFHLEPGQVLEIGAAQSGNYGYLSVAGGMDVPVVLGSRSTHVRAGFGGFYGRCLKANDIVPIGESDRVPSPQRFLEQRQDTGEDIRILWGAQAQMFDDEQLRRFAETRFAITHELDRMGVRLMSEMASFQADRGLVAISGIVAAGDIQISGDGQPVVLLSDRQPTGGYPRIATIITADIAAFSQRQIGSFIRFIPVTETEALAALKGWYEQRQRLPEQLVKGNDNPLETHRLLSQNLISGVVSSLPDKPNKDET